MALNFKQIFWLIVFFTVILPPDAHPYSSITPGAVSGVAPMVPGRQANLSGKRQHHNFFWQVGNPFRVPYVL